MYKCIFCVGVRVGDRLIDWCEILEMNFKHSSARQLLQGRRKITWQSYFWRRHQQPEPQSSWPSQNRIWLLLHPRPPLWLHYILSARKLKELRSRIFLRMMNYQIDLPPMVVAWWSKGYLVGSEVVGPRRAIDVPLNPGAVASRFGSLDPRCHPSEFQDWYQHYINTLNIISTHLNILPLIIERKGSWSLLLPLRKLRITCKNFIILCFIW